MWRVRFSSTDMLILLVKQIIHIEVCEAEFKRKKAQLEKGTRCFFTSSHKTVKQGEPDAKADGNKETDDLEMIGGTSEDDFTEAIAMVR